MPTFNLSTRRFASPVPRFGARRYSAYPSVAGGASFSLEALAFFNAAGITDPTQQNAINTLVLSLKSASIWTPLNAIYPIVGGTAASHKWNLKNPVDSDAAFRLSFAGGWTHNSSGITGNGTTNYADTFFIPSVQQTATAGSLGCYCTGESILSQTEMGSESLSNYTWVVTRYTGDASYYGYGDAAFISTPSAGGSGFFVNNRNGGTTELWRSGTKLAESTYAATLPTSSFYLGATNASGFLYQPSDRTLKFAILSGSTLTTQNQADLYAAVLAYQTALGRA